MVEEHVPLSWKQHYLETRYSCGCILPKTLKTISLRRAQDWILSGAFAGRSSLPMPAKQKMGMFSPLASRNSSSNPYIPNIGFYVCVYIHTHTHTKP